MSDLYYNQFNGYEYYTVNHKGMDVVLVKDPECGFTAWLKDIPGVVCEGDNEEQALSEIELCYEAYQIFNAMEGDS